MVSYEQLLAAFWDSHNPVYQERSRQYMSIIFYHDEQQRELALASMAQQQAALGRTIYTEVVPFERFYMAEDYHQKYYLRRSSELTAELRAVYPDLSGYVNSTMVARINGYLGGNGTSATLRAELASYGLSASAGDELRRYVGVR